MYNRTNKNNTKKYAGTKIGNTQIHLIVPKKSTKRAKTLNVYQRGNKVTLNGREIFALKQLLNKTARF